MKLFNKILGLLSVVLLFSQTLSAEVTYYHNDLQGSAVAATDEQGNVKWREVYQPFGDKLLNEQASGANKQGYISKYHDSELGLTYMNARMYDPVVGRFMGIDPVGFFDSNPMSFNRYLYSNNNPYKLKDPNGDIATLVSGGIGALLGGALEVGVQLYSNRNLGLGGAISNLDVSKIIESTVVGGFIGLTGGAGAEIAAGLKGGKIAQTLSGAAGSGLGNLFLSRQIDRDKGISRPFSDYIKESAGVAAGYIAGGAFEELFDVAGAQVARYLPKSKKKKSDAGATAGSVITIKILKVTGTTVVDDKTNEKTQEVLDGG